MLRLGPAGWLVVAMTPACTTDQPTASASTASASTASAATASASPSPATGVGSTSVSLDAPTAAPSASPRDASPGATGAASAAPTHAPPAPSTAAVAPGPPRTGRPSPRRWCEAPQLHLLGDPATPVCSFIEVDEWIMVACPPSGDRGARDLGRYDHARPGGGSIATPEELAVGPDPSAKDAVVISLRPGTRAAPLFYYRPVDHPEWTREETFTFAMPGGATGLGDRELPRVWQTTERSTERCAALEPPAPAAPEQTPEIPDVAGHPPPPDDAAWDAEREVLATGSDALGCKTRLKGGWFRATCQGKATFSSITVERGRHATQTTAVVESGALTVLTPHVDGTDFRARITSDAGQHVLTLRWPAGSKRPYEVATFRAASD